MMDFTYQNPLPLGQDKTKYRHIKGSEQYVSSEPFADLEMLKVAPEGLQELARLAMHDVSFFLRPAHNHQVAQILDDPEASDNDRAVAMAMLRNAEIAALGVLPICQDTGTAIIMAKKGQQVWTGCDDAEQLSAGIFTTYARENLRYSQNAPLTMYDEVNTGDNLPAQIDIYAKPGDKYEFLFILKGGGSANKSFLYQQTKSLLNEENLTSFIKEKIKDL